jgi:hypothetical protein
MRLAYMLIELDDAVSRLEGTREPTFQEMGAEAWLALRQRSRLSCQSLQTSCVALSEACF